MDAATRDALWQAIGVLIGQTVDTVRGRPFTILSVARHKDAAVEIAPVSTGKPRKLYRESLEGAYLLWKREGGVTPSRVREEGLSERNPAYVAALIQAVGPRVEALRRET